MKKIIKFSLIIIILLLALSDLYGQDALNKGVYSIAGSAQYSSSVQNVDGNSYTFNTGNISPQFTFFIANHISVGAAVSYNYSFFKGPEGNNLEQVSKNTYLTLGPSIRYYFNAKKVVPFLEASFNYGVYGIENIPAQTSYNYGFKGGLEIFLSRSVALEPSIGYSRINSNYFGDSDNFDLGVGVSYFIF
jgi:hypothetical protein